MEGSSIERFVPNSQLHLEKQVILSELVLHNSLSDHLERVVAVLVDSGLPAAEVQWRGSIRGQSCEEGINLDSGEADLIGDHGLVELGPREGLHMETSSRSAQALEGEL